LSHHDHAPPAGRKLLYGIGLSFTILIMEVVGGLLANSLALLSDAGHVFTDIIALGLSWYGVRQATRRSNSRMTFGYHRIGVMVAIVNSLSIFAIAAAILYEAYNRFQSAPEVNSLLMMAVAAVGLAANIVVAFWLRSEQKGNINIRSAFWHAFGDALASIGVIVGGVVILTTGLFWVDPLVSVVISLIILFSAWNILREGARVLLEATPKDINVMEMIHTLKQIQGVRDVHDVHVWSITPDLRAMNGHILIDDVATSKASEIREMIETVMREKYRVGHTTLQMECSNCNAADTFCNLNQCEVHGHEEESEGKHQDIDIKR
jgi:cobalt-zinc-cadmium efflux system protein